MGSRFGGLKQIVPVGPRGETLLEYAIYDAARAGFGKAVVVIKSTFEQVFCEQVLPRLRGHIEVHFALQDKTPVVDEIDLTRNRLWGTGHAVLVAGQKIEEPFVVINADDYYGRNAFTAAHDAFQQRWQTGNASFFLVSYELGTTLSPHGPVSRAICELDGGKLTGLVEHTRLERNEGRVESSGEGEQPTTFGLATPVSMNFWGFSPELFRHLRPLLESFVREYANSPDQEFRLSDAVHQLVSTGVAEVDVLPEGKAWFGITYQADHDDVCRRIARLVNAGAYPEPLWAN